jgi:hypothetical protein
MVDTKLYNMIDFRKIAINLNLIEANKTINLEKLPDHILNNSKIEHRIKAIFNTIHYKHYLFQLE